MKEREIATENQKILFLHYTPRGLYNCHKFAKQNKRMIYRVQDGESVRRRQTRSLKDRECVLLLLVVGTWAVTLLLVLIPQMVHYTVFCTCWGEVQFCRQDFSVEPWLS